MKRVERIKEYLEGLLDSSLIAIWNEYCNYCRYDDYVYSMAEIDEVLREMPASEILRSSYYGDINPNDDYFKYNGRGNLVSTSTIGEWVEIDELAEYIDEREKDFGDSKIRDILWGDYEEEE